MSQMGLWPHQQQVFELLMAGKNVILTAPTGSGKTRAAIYPFLTALDPVDNPYYGRLPYKCIYAVPMRILAQQFFHEYDAIVERYADRYKLKITRSIQTGEQADDPTFAADLIFATIDQVLSSFLLAPYSLPKSRANLNAGAILSSYLVVDELHLLDPSSTLPTTLHMLKLLKGIVPFLLMTATFSRTMLNDLATQLDAVIVPHPNDAEAQAAIRNLPSQQKTRRYHVLDAPMDAKAILSRHKDRTLVICNTVDRARAIYEQLMTLVAADIQVFLLHSRFLPEHRSATEDAVRRLFGKGWRKAGGSAIVVSTQAIEVGVDITSTVLHTELAPANAVIQRAGRCARYEGDEGDVFIYTQATGRDGETIALTENIAPYTAQKDEFAATAEAFRPYSGRAVSSADEWAILSAVHDERDRQIIAQLQEESAGHKAAMFAVMRGSDSHDARHLIREVASQRVTIHADPNATLREAPFDVPAFGLHPGTVKGYLKNWLEQATALDLPDAGVWILHDYGDEAESREERFRFVPISEPKSAQGAPLLVVHPALASYDSTLGFLGDRGNVSADLWQAELPIQDQRRVHRPYRYVKETYERHIELVYAAFQTFWPEVAYAAKQIELRYGWSEGSIREAAELAVLLHDVGKLSTGWQTWAHRYQQAVCDADDHTDYAPVAGEAYAHTTVDGDRFKEIERGIKPARPWHAVEGAVASIPIVSAHFGSKHPLTQTVFSAIARHHSAFAETGHAYTLVPDALQHVASVMNFPVQKLIDEGKATHMQQASLLIADAALSKHREAFLAYLLIVRALRRADAEGTKRGTFDAN